MATLIPAMSSCVSRMTGDNKDDGIPLLKPVSCGREGREPPILKLPTLQAEAEAIADHLAQAHQEGFAWGDMAVLCADTKTRDLCARTLAQRKLPAGREPAGLRRL